jgi:hypothetical protein
VEGTDEEEGRWPGSLGIYSKTVGRAPILLIVGVLVLADGPAGGDELTAAQSVLLRLVRKQKPAGDYASTVVRDAGRQEIYLAFEDGGDAKEFAAATNAKATGSYPGWASQRAVRLDGAKVTALAASLPAPKTRPRQPLPEEGSMPRRGRRWVLPQAPSTSRD